MKPTDLSSCVESERNRQVCFCQHRDSLTKGQFGERRDEQAEKEKSWKVKIFQIKLINLKIVKNSYTEEVRQTDKESKQRI